MRQEKQISDEDRIRAWELPTKVENDILNNSQLQKRLLESKEKFPLPPNYFPRQINIFFNNILVLNWKDGSYRIFNREIRNIEPDYIEMQIDTETVLFLVNGILAIDRLEESIKNKNLEIILNL